MKKIIIAVALATISTISAAGDLAVKVVDTTPIGFGAATAKDLNQMTFESKGVIDEPVGTKIELCPVFKKSARVGSDGINIAEIKNGSVVMRFFRDDGVTPITPEKCWPVVVSAEQVTIKSKIEIVGEYYGPIESSSPLISVKR